MTVKRAEAIYRILSKKRYATLEPYEKDLLKEVTQVLRYAKRRRNPVRAVTIRSVKPVVIYRRVLRMEAQKVGKHRCDKECRAANHCYFHDFSKSANAHALGLPDGTVLLKGSKRLWGMF